MKYLKPFNESDIGLNKTSNTEYTASGFIGKLKRLNFINGSLYPEKGEKGSLFTGSKDGYNVRVMVDKSQNVLDNTFDINVSNPNDSSTKGFNSYDEDSDAVDIYFKDIITIIKDLNN